MNAGDVVELRGGRRIVAVAGAAAIVGIAVLVAGAFVDTRRTLFAYLTAFSYVVSTAVGALIFLMICHAMHAGWPTLLRRLTEAIVATLPLCAALSVPVLAGLPLLYPWFRPEAIEEERVRQILALRAPYLVPGWFVGRTAIYFAIWIFVGFWLRRWSRAMDRGPDPVAADRMYAMSGVLLPLVGLAVSFAAFDWIMTLMPVWASTMFPVCYFAGGFIGALALLTVLTAAADRARLVPGVNPSHYYALGRLLLAFVIFWAYTQFFQLMLMWIADKPDEVTFYLDRLRGGWAVVTVILVLTQFVVPFFLLLSYDLKRRRGPLAAIALWLVAAHYLDTHWMVVPAARSAGAAGILLDVGALLAVAGVTVVYGVLRLRGVPMVPVHDPALGRAVRYESV
jgi:hypothetical protein